MRSPIDLSGAAWRKSNYSGENGGSVEVATNLPAVVAVRDSTDPTDPTGPALVFSLSAWKRFTNKLRNDELHSTT
ncbi:uncharacterized protein DUF397 [Actinomadura pelletieri DSM 43383]|uniref:Uncharacterized protein DUF397 n=1 Tax=Actinomadura pelletieri DSM 43383 TaxID=1120940 RepID=A0A495QSA7_9ACTN|nr:DUF397 domain-containing protein [Actinomadura pelletieri]RKS76386.1 uncharacterized protein DUF397 [Actinomadura pelletieri DSM 43383]